MGRANGHERETPGRFILCVTKRGEIMLAATYAIKAGFTVDQLAATWAPCLTMAESIRIVEGLFRNQMPTSCCA